MKVRLSDLRIPQLSVVQLTMVAHCASGNGHVLCSSGAKAYASATGNGHDDGSDNVQILASGGIRTSDVTNLASDVTNITLLYKIYITCDIIGNHNRLSFIKEYSVK